MKMMKKKTMMNKIIKKLDWWFDYYIAYFLYNGNKQGKYVDYMTKKWGNKKNEYKS